MAVFDSVSNRNEYIFPGDKGGRYVGLTTLPPSCVDCFEIWEPQPPGILRSYPGIAFAKTFNCYTEKTKASKSWCSLNFRSRNLPPLQRNVTEFCLLSSPSVSVHLATHM